MKTSQIKQKQSKTIKRVKIGVYSGFPLVSRSFPARFPLVSGVSRSFPARFPVVSRSFSDMSPKSIQSSKNKQKQAKIVQIAKNKQDQANTSKIKQNSRKQTKIVKIVKNKQDQANTTKTSDNKQ